MLYKAKSNHSLIKGKDLSLLHLTTLSNFLETQQGLTQDINKEIKNQIQISQKNQRIIDKSMNLINDRAEQLVRKFQEEKQKHEKLTFLVNHIESEIYNAKLDKSIEQKNKAGTDQLEQLTTVLHTRERQLQKIFQKTNSSSYEMSKKLDSIRGLRSERTIVSELLDKIQRELCNLEHCYKVLLIQRTIEDHDCQEKLEDFRKMEQSARKQIERAYNAQKNQKLHREEEEQIRLTVRQPYHQEAFVTTYIRPSLVTDVQQPSQINLRQANQGETNKEKEKRAKIQADIQKLQRQKIVKIALNNLGLSSPKQLPQSVEALSKENEDTLFKLSELQQEIEKMQAAVLQLSLKKKRSIKIQSGKKQASLHYRQDLNSLKQQIHQNRFQASQFKEFAKILYSSITESMSSPPQKCDFYNEEEQVKYYMGFLESFFQKSYLKSKNVQHSPKKGNESKRLTSLLNGHLLQRNHMSIYKEQDLLEFAKKNLQKLDRSCSHSEK